MSVKSNIGVVTDGLVLYLDAGNEKSYAGTGTTWSDLSGDENNCTLANTPTFSSNNGGYFQFNGVNEYVDTNFDATSYFPLSVCFWINLETLIESGSNIFLDQSTGAVGMGFRYRGGIEQVEAFWYDTGNSNLATLIPINEFSTNTWHYMCVTFNTNSIKGYLDGSLSASNVVSLTSSGRSLDTSNNAKIASYNDSSGGYLDGKIASVQIYNKELSSDEILKNYNALKNRFV